MERLYLIRVGMERFLGPFTLKQVQDAYHKMQFGLQDEISGGLRQWVTFDNIEAIRRHYPELVQLIHSEMMSGWGMTVAPGSTPNARMRMDTGFSKPASSGRGLLFVTLFLIVLGAVIGMLSYRDGEFVNPILYMQNRPYYQAKSLLGDHYNARFEGYMDRNRQEINQAMKKRKGYIQWLPYVRAVAFSRDGRWEGMTAKKLKGAAENFLPADCSVAAWDDRWRDSRANWMPFIEGRRLPKEEWSRLLMIDSHWLKNRSPMAGWEEPGSYHEACLRTALKSLVKMTVDDSSSDAKVFLSRLRWQLGAIAGTSPSAEYEMSGTLWAMSCLEDAHLNDDLKNCFNSVKVRGPWQDFFEAMTLVRRMAILTTEAQLSDSDVRELQTLLTQFTPKAGELFLNYEEEIKLYQEVIAQKGNVKAAKSAIQKRYPGVHFEP